MANARQIKTRIKSAQNIAKITKAMEMVSASKMRRAQDQVLSSRPYADRLTSTLQTIAAFAPQAQHLLLLPQPLGIPALILIGTDKGLCGPLNTNVFKAALEIREHNPETVLITIGKKAHEFAQCNAWKEVAAFTTIPERVSFSDILPIAQLITEGYTNGDFSSVSALSMKFITTLKQDITNSPLLPINPQGNGDIIAEPGEMIASEYVFEPDAQSLLKDLLPYYLEVELYQLLLDARASEHSARMISMQNASNNARDVVGSLRLEYNKSRQAGITKELLEITTATLALEPTA